MTQVDERLAKVGQNLKKFISESKYKTQVSFALNGMGQDPSVIRRWIKHGVNRALLNLMGFYGVD